MLDDEKFEIIPLNIHNFSYLFFDKSSKMQAKEKNNMKQQMLLGKLNVHMLKNYSRLVSTRLQKTNSK